MSKMLKYIIKPILMSCRASVTKANIQENYMSVSQDHGELDLNGQGHQDGHNFDVLSHR